MTEEHQDSAERAYINGHRAAWLGLLGQAISELRGDGASLQDPKIALASAVAELERARAALRDVCGAYGDNDWSDDLDLADVIEKHLGRNLDERLGGR